MSVLSVKQGSTVFSEQDADHIQGLPIKSMYLLLFSSLLSDVSAFSFCKEASFTGILAFLLPSSLFLNGFPKGTKMKTILLQNCYIKVMRILQHYNNL